MADQISFGSYTQSQIAKMCNVTQQAVSRWKAKGAVPLETAIFLHQKTNIPLSKLNPSLAVMLSEVKHVRA